MKRILSVFAVLLAVCCSPEAALNREAEADYARPIRKGEPYWNVFAKKFTYAPAFGFPRVEGAGRYEYRISRSDSLLASFSAAAPDEDLGRVWSGISPGP